MSFGTDELLERRWIHEVVAAIVFVDIFEVTLFHIGALDLLGRPVALGDLDAICNAPHFEMRHRRAFAGMDVIRLQYGA